MSNRDNIGGNQRCNKGKGRWTTRNIKDMDSPYFTAKDLMEI
jgi:hypothetical protein